MLNDTWGNEVLKGAWAAFGTFPAPVLMPYIFAVLWASLQNEKRTSLSHHLHLRAKTQNNSYLKLPPNRKTSNQYFGGSTLTFLTHSHKMYRTSLMQTNSFAKALGWNPTHSLQWHVRPLDVNKTEFCLLSFVHSSMASTSNSLTDSSFDVTVSSINRWNSNKTWRGPTLQTSFPKFSGLGWYWRDACREVSDKWRSKQDLAAASHLHHS